MSDCHPFKWALTESSHNGPPPLSGGSLLCFPHAAWAASTGPSASSALSARLSNNAPLSLSPPHRRTGV